jgi:hypothetical protein
MKPSIEFVRESLDYDPETGVIRWKVNRSQKKAGELAGFTKSDGYKIITINRRQIGCHTIAWAIYHGEWPSLLIDHIDMNHANNRIENLRLATIAQNQHNATLKRGNTTGYKGVSFQKRDNRYRAQIQVHKKRIALGWFETADEAAHAYNKAAITHHGEYARLNVPGMPYAEMDCATMITGEAHA